MIEIECITIYTLLYACDLQILFSNIIEGHLNRALSRFFDDVLEAINECYAILRGNDLILGDGGAQCYQSLSLIRP